MKTCLFCLVVALSYFIEAPDQQTFVGSTPGHSVVRSFLGIASTDSIDFIRWKLEINANRFTLQCQYGLSKPSTPDFINEKRVAFEGDLTKKENHYFLLYHGKRLSLLEVNGSLLHLLDEHKQMLIGNGGYSFALNNIDTVKADQFNIQPSQSTVNGPLVFEGRTPCQELSALLDLNKSEACNKMKWYMIFYKDSVTGKPSYYLKGGIGYRKETMERGTWKMITGKNGRIIYQVNPDKQDYTLYLLKGDDNILFFIDPTGRLLVGNEDFSYTLNRRKEEYAPIYR